MSLHGDPDCKTVNSTWIWIHELPTNWPCTLSTAAVYLSAVERRFIRGNTTVNNHPVWNIKGGSKASLSNWSWTEAPLRKVANILRSTQAFCRATHTNTFHHKWQMLAWFNTINLILAQDMPFYKLTSSLLHSSGFRRTLISIRTSLSRSDCHPLEFSTCFYLVNWISVFITIVTTHDLL